MAFKRPSETGIRFFEAEELKPGYLEQLETALRILELAEGVELSKEEFSEVVRIAHIYLHACLGTSGVSEERGDGQT